MSLKVTLANIFDSSSFDFCGIAVVLSSVTTWLFSFESWSSITSVIKIGSSIISWLSWLESDNSSVFWLETDSSTVFWSETDSSTFFVSMDGTFSSDIDNL